MENKMNNTILKKKLKQAIKLLEKGWIRFSLAQKKNGTGVYYKSKEATSFCLIGACRAAEINSDDDLGFIQLFIPKPYTNVSLSTYNDFYAKTRQGPIGVLRRALKNV
jgi:hypothetical protein